MRDRSKSRCLLGRPVEPGNDRREGRATHAREAEELRSLANMLCLWRLCGNGACRRARTCRGRAHLCGRRNFASLPKGVRKFFHEFLAAKWVGVSFETFVEEMEDRDETRAFFAWRHAARERRQ